MRFGKQHLSTRLVIARVVVYCQAAALALVAINLLEVLLIGGTGSGLSFRGVFTSIPISGNGAMVSALAFLVVALVLIFVEQRAAGGGGARQTLAVVEIAFAVCFVGFVANAAGGWLFGVVAALAVVGLHYWLELKAYFFADDAPAPASDGEAMASATLATMSSAAVPPSSTAGPPAATVAPPFAPPAPPPAPAPAPPFASQLAPPAFPIPPDPNARVGSRETAPPHL